MKDIGPIGTILTAAGFFVLIYGAIRYGSDLLNHTVDRDNVFIGAAGCTGLTGATLAACQKAQPKPKPAGITPAKPKGITAAKPKPQGITAADPTPNTTQKTRARSTGGGVGGPTSKALACKQKGGTWQAYPAAGGTAFRCLMPVTAPSRSVFTYNQCVKNARLYTERLKKLATDRNAVRWGYQGLNPGLQLLNNNVGTSQAAGYQDRLIREKYSALFRDLDRACAKKYLGIDYIAMQERGMVPSAEMKNQPV